MQPRPPKPGRPPLPPALRTSGHTIRLTAAQWSLVRHIGDGNPSEGVRRMYEALRRLGDGNPSEGVRRLLGLCKQ